MLNSCINCLPWWLRRSCWFRRWVEGSAQGCVLSGPFRGMRFVGGDISGGHWPMLLGTHEMELHAVLEHMTSLPLTTVINIGAAEGYYSVGMALRMPAATVHAFETLNTGQAAIDQMARINGVSDRVIVHGKCEPNQLAAVLNQRHPPTAIICDVEGYEDQLLDPARVPGLEGCYILCEVHDMFAVGVGERLRGRFDETHILESIVTTPRTIRDWPISSLCLRALFSRRMVRVLDERRGYSMYWFWMEPRKT